MSIANRLTIVRKSAKHFFDFLFGRLRELFLLAESEIICPEGLRATSPIKGGWLGDRKYLPLRLTSRFTEVAFSLVEEISPRHSQS